MSSRWVSKPPPGSVVNWGHPLSKGLVGAWLMNEGGGNVVNDIASKNNGLLNVINWSGRNGSNIDFDGITSVVSLNKKNTFSSSSKITIVAGVLAHSLVGYHTVMCKRDTSGTSYQFRFGANSGDAKFVFLWTQGATNQPYSSLMTLGTNKLSHVACSFDWSQPGSVNFFKNGILNTTVRDSGSGTTPDNPDIVETIGRRSDDSQEFDGNIYYVFKYNRSLSPSEIKSLYESPYQFIKGPSTITYFTPPQATGWVWGGEVKNVMVA